MQQKKKKKKKKQTNWKSMTFLRREGRLQSKLPP